MNCEISAAEWTDYLDRTLPVSRRRQVDSHLHTCAECRALLESLGEADRRLRIECGLFRQAIGVSRESREAAQRRILAALREHSPKGPQDRLWRVRWVLALLCGSHTAIRIIQAAESHSGAASSPQNPAEQNWLAFLRRLSFLTTEICGSGAGELVWMVGQ